MQETHRRPDFFLIFSQRVRHVLEATFPWVGLGIYEVYRTDPNYIYAFMTGLNLEMKAIVVQLWSPQSSMVVYGGSHLLSIKGFNASNGLLEIPSVSSTSQISIKPNRAICQEISQAQL
jgi:hypothetical protein